MRSIVILALITFVLFLMLFPASPHEWYPPDCCSGQDCVGQPDSRFQRIPDGRYLVDGKWTFQPVDARPMATGETRFSKSGRYHTCEPVKGERPKCIFVPPEGT